MKEKKLYTKVRYMRERIGATQEDFARLVGCGIPNYANKENGRVPWSLDECFILRDHINKKLKQLGESDMQIVDTLFSPDIVAKKITKKKKTAS